MTFDEVLKEVKKGNDSPWFEYFDEHDDEFQLEIDNYDEDNYGWGIYYHADTNKFIYVQQDENDAVVYEVAEIARLICHHEDINTRLYEELYGLIGSAISGFSLQEDTEGNIRYLWFNVVK